MGASPIWAVFAATILALLAFIMAFTFGIVSDRYDARKVLVREEANAIRTAWSRSDFLPEPDRAEAVRLLRDYVDLRLTAVRSGDTARVRAAVVESVRIQRQLWGMAVANARKDTNSYVAAVGYHTAIAGSRRSWIMLILALSFSLVIALIAALDRTEGGYLPVSQQALEDLRASMDTGTAASVGSRGRAGPQVTVSRPMPSDATCSTLPNQTLGSSPSLLRFAEFEDTAVGLARTREQLAFGEGDLEQPLPSLRAREANHGVRSPSPDLGDERTADRALPDHSVVTAHEKGWATLTNNELLAAAEGSFDVFVTTDRNMRYQLRLHVAAIATAVAALRPGELQEWSFPD